MRDDNGPGNWLLDPIRGWPKCDFCGRIMERDPSSGPHAFVADCNCELGHSLSFDSCRYGHRYCAWERLHPLREKHAI